MTAIVRQPTRVRLTLAQRRSESGSSSCERVDGLSLRDGSTRATNQRGVLDRSSPAPHLLKHGAPKYEMQRLNTGHARRADADPCVTDRLMGRWTGRPPVGHE